VRAVFDSDRGFDAMFDIVNRDEIPRAKPSLSWMLQWTEESRPLAANVRSHEARRLEALLLLALRTCLTDCANDSELHSRLRSEGSHVILRLPTSFGSRSSQPPTLTPLPGEDAAGWHRL
jgi:hypothetical protein